ncbi:MAG: hypothetical protein HYX53_07825 [Chloroflexi bacterium]|nr:hypothetical protein [Chloroflexota bacterium]
MSGAPTAISTLAAVPSPLASSTAQASPAPGRVTLSGVLSVAIGDPPGGSGPARTAARLTEPNGTRWTLTFDDNVFRPAGNLLGWNLKRVNVEGVSTGQPNTIVVTSLTLAQ